MTHFACQYCSKYALVYVYTQPYQTGGMVGREYRGWLYDLDAGRDNLVTLSARALIVCSSGKMLLIKASVG